MPALQLSDLPMFFHERADPLRLWRTNLSCLSDSFVPDSGLNHIRSAMMAARATAEMSGDFLRGLEQRPATKYGALFQSFLLIR